MKKDRLLEIDMVKAICILSVVCIHANSTAFDPPSNIGKLIGSFTRYSVPGLIFAAGFLFRKDGTNDLLLIRKLLLRILPPYLIWSCVILLFNLPGNRVPLSQISFSEFLSNLIFGNTIGIYYFVFVILYLYALSFIFKKLPIHMIHILWIVSGAGVYLFYTHLTFFVPVSPDIFIFTLTRHPSVTLFPYLSGWIFSLHFFKIRTFLSNHFKVGLLCVVIIDVVAFVVTQQIPSPITAQLAVQFHIYFFMLLLIFLGLKSSKMDNLVVYFSRNSYGIYLVHFPIVRGFQALYPDITKDFSLVYSSLALCIGTIGAVVVVAVIKRLTGKYSFYIVGT